MSRLIQIASAALIACPVFLFKVLEHNPRTWEGPAARATSAAAWNDRASIEQTATRGGVAAEDSSPGMHLPGLRGAVVDAISNGRYSDKQLLAILGEAKKPEYRREFPQFDGFVADASGLVKTPPIGRPVDGIAVLPNNNETFVTTFNRPPKNGELEEINLVSTTLAGDLTTDPGNLPRSLAQFRQRLDRSPSDFFVVAGHNERGALIIPPPPQPLARLELKSMAKSCATAKKICIMVSCQSSAYVPQASAGVVALHRDLTFLDAGQISIELRRIIVLASGNGYTESDVLKAIPILIQDLERDQRIAMGVRIAFLPAVIVGAGGGAVILTAATEGEN